MQQTVFSIGHSTHQEEKFLELLQRHCVDAVCDVRSVPYSRVNPQFNRSVLSQRLKENRIEYVFLGKELGARSEDPTCYENGKVQYERLAQTFLFRRGIERVKKGMQKYRLALMCAEKEPLECHRTILVARHLTECGVDIQHIHGNGRLESHADALKRLTVMLNLPQVEMFMPQQPDVLAAAYRRQEERIAYDSTKRQVAAFAAPAAGGAG
jgi:uncharacterized protein (DUF488 family)